MSKIYLSLVIYKYDEKLGCIIIIWSCFCHCLCLCSGVCIGRGHMQEQNCSSLGFSNDKEYLLRVLVLF